MAMQHPSLVDAAILRNEPHNSLACGIVQKYLLHELHPDVLLNRRATPQVDSFLRIIRNVVEAIGVCRVAKKLVLRGKHGRCDFVDVKTSGII